MSWLQDRKITVDYPGRPKAITWTLESKGGNQRDMDKGLMRDIWSVRRPPLANGDLKIEGNT